MYIFSIHKNLVLKVAFNKPYKMSYLTVLGFDGQCLNVSQHSSGPNKAPSRAR